MKKRILFLIHDLQCGGAEKVLINLVNSLDQEKYDITVQTIFDVGTLRGKFAEGIAYIPGFRKMFRGNSTLGKLFTPKQLCKMFIKDEYDLVVSFLQGQCSRIVSAYKGKKISWFHAEYISKEAISNSFRSFDEAKECYSKFDKIVCVAKTVEDNFNSYFHLEDKTQVIYNLIDTESIIEASKEQQDLIVPSDDYFNLISVGRLVNNQKGFDRLIRIHKRLLNKGIDNRLYLLGEGKDRLRIEKLISDLGVTNTVVLTGFVENPYKYVKDADLFVCSSHKEGYSTATTEAIVLGVPVVSTDVSGANELIINGCGVVCDNNDQALFENIQKMLDQEVLTKVGYGFNNSKSLCEINELINYLFKDGG